MAAVDYEAIARYYDSLVTGTEDLAFFVGRCRSAGGPAVELMAGTGRLSVPLAAAGIELTCVDSSAAMLGKLEQKLRACGASARLVHQDVTELDLDAPHALAFIAFHSFEELVTDDEREQALARVRDHVAPGGRFICTLHDPEVRLESVGPGRDRVIPFRDAEGRDLVLRLETTYDPATAIVHGREQLEDALTGERLVDLPMRFRLTTADAFRGLAEAVGFTVDALYGGFDGAPYVEGKSVSQVWVLA